jgi:putative membrane protein
MSWIILRLSILSVGIFIASYLIPGIEVTGYGPIIKAAVLLGIFQIFIKPILLILTIPINLLTLGLFTLFVNGFLFWAAGQFVEGFTVHGVFVSVAGAIIISILSIFVNSIKAPNGRRRR